MSQPESTDHNIQSITLVVACPECGAEDYEFDIDPAGLRAHHSDHSVPCDDCGRDISVRVSVDVQSEEPQP